MLWSRYRFGGYNSFMQRQFLFLSVCWDVVTTGFTKSGISSKANIYYIYWPSVSFKSFLTMLTREYNWIPVTRFASQTEGKFGQLYQQSFKTPPYPNMLIPTTDSKIFLKFFLWLPIYLLNFVTRRKSNVLTIMRFTFKRGRNCHYKSTK